MTARALDTHAAAAISTRGDLTAGASGTRAAAMKTAVSSAKQAEASGTWHQVGMDPRHGAEGTALATAVSISKRAAAAVAWGQVTLHLHHGAEGTAMTTASPTMKRMATFGIEHRVKTHAPLKRGSLS